MFSVIAAIFHSYLAMHETIRCLAAPSVSPLSVCESRGLIAERGEHGHNVVGVD